LALNSLNTHAKTILALGLHSLCVLNSEKHLNS